ncbi:MAG: class I SAM-dependent methyltransferase [Thermoprotei archaeon]
MGNTREPVQASYCWDRYGWVLDSTIEWFSKRGAGYRVVPWRYGFLERYIRGYVVDLGCGVAATSKYYLNRGLAKRLVLIDMSHSSLLAACRDNPVISCICSDILSTPFRDNVFDTVLLLAVLHHIPDELCRRRLLWESHRILRRGGYVVVTVWNPDLELLMDKYVLERVENRGYVLVDKSGRRYYYFYRGEELVRDVSSYFRVVEEGVFIQSPSNPRLTRNLYVVGVKE